MWTVYTKRTVRVSRWLSKRPTRLEISKFIQVFFSQESFSVRSDLRLWDTYNTYGLRLLNRSFFDKRYFFADDLCLVENSLNAECECSTMAYRSDRSVSIPSNRVVCADNRRVGGVKSIRALSAFGEGLSTFCQGTSYFLHRYTFVYYPQKLWRLWFSSWSSLPCSWSSPLTSPPPPSPPPETPQPTPPTACYIGSDVVIYAVSWREYADSVVRVGAKHSADKLLFDVDVQTLLIRYANTCVPMDSIIWHCVVFVMHTDLCTGPTTFFTARVTELFQNLFCDTFFEKWEWRFGRYMNHWLGAKYWRDAEDIAIVGTPPSLPSETPQPTPPKAW